jgi:hypothetical protein
MSGILIPRRTFLKGTGTALALPLLEAMLPQSVLAAPALKQRPLRLGFFFVPNGVHMQDWTPKNQGPLEQLPYILEPLAPYTNNLTVLSGLTQDKARPNGDGPGDHARSAAAWLTGCQPRKTSGADIKVGISVDQYAALQVGNRTRFASLELGVERGAQAGNCDSGYSCAYSSTVSWRSESTPVAKEVDPRLVFDRLFSTGDKREVDESRARRDQYKSSVLDFVTEDANRLKGQLGAKDLQKLDEYFTSVREIEKRIELAGRVSSQGPSGAARPTGVPSEYAEHVRLMLDMLALAIQTDQTRVTTFMFANEGSNRPYRNIGISDGHHDLSHHQNDPEKHAKIRQINRFHMENYAYLLGKLAGMKEGNGTVLDNCLFVYGGGIGDGNRHNHDDLPILLVGKGGGTIKPGRHVQYPRNTPLNNLFLSLMDRMHVPCQSLGDSTGRLTGLT